MCPKSDNAWWERSDSGRVAALTGDVQESSVPCPHCAVTAIVAQRRRPALGYRTFRCPACRRIGNEPTGAPFKHVQ